MPPGHHAARLVILAVLTGGMVAGALSGGVATGAGWAIDWGRQAALAIWQPLLPDSDRADPRSAPPSAPSPSGARPRR